MRKVLLAGAAAGAAALLTMSGAWACSPSGFIDIDPRVALPGTEVGAVGENFVPGTVSIQWLGNPRRELATVTVTAVPVPGPYGFGASFATRVTVPADVLPGDYTIRAVQYKANGSVGQQGAVQLTVPERAVVPPVVVPPTPPTSTQPSPAPAPAPAPTQAGVPVASDATPARQPAVVGQPAPVAGVPRATAARPAAPTASSPVVAAVEPGAGAPPAERPAVQVNAPAPSSISPGALDLWSGVEPGRGRVGGGASLSAPPTTRPDNGSRLALGLLTLGGVSLLGGVLVAAPSRRRVRA